MSKTPLDPADVVPLLKVSAPLMPRVPALDVLKTMLPLDVSVPMAV